jgi:hypothetical protein
MLDASGLVGSIASATLQQLIGIIFEQATAECQVILQELCRIAEGSEVKIARLKGLSASLSLELIENVIDGNNEALVDKVVVPFLQDALVTPPQSFPLCVRTARIIKRLSQTLSTNILEALKQHTSIRLLLFEVLAENAMKLEPEQHLPLTKALLDFEQDLPALGSYAQASEVKADTEISSDGLVVEAAPTSSGLGPWLLPERKLISSPSLQQPDLPNYDLMLIHQIVTTLSRRASPAWRNLLRLNSAFLSSSIAEPLERDCIENLAALTTTIGADEDVGAARKTCLKRLGRLALAASVGKYMSTRSYNCLESFLNTAQSLQESFDSASWRIVLDIIRFAEPLLDIKRGSVADGDGRAQDVQLSAKLSQRIQDSFVSTSELSDSAFAALLNALLHTEDSNATTPLASPTFVRTRLLSVASFTSTMTPIQAGQAQEAPERSSFTLGKLALICTSNGSRFAQSGGESWEMVRAYLATEIDESESLLAAETLSAVIRNATSNQRVEQQKRFIKAIADLSSRSLLIKTIQMDTIAHVLQYAGDSLTYWDLLLNVIHQAVSTAEMLPQSVPSTPMTPRSFNDHFPESSERSRASLVATLVRSAFGSLELICSDYLAGLPYGHYPELIEILIVCCMQTADINISLASVNLLWAVADALPMPVDLAEDRLWAVLISALIQIAHHETREVRSSAIGIIFRLLDGTLLRLGVDAWSNGISLLLEPISGISDPETLCLIVSGSTRTFSNVLPKLANSALLQKIWTGQMMLLGRSAPLDGVATTAIQNFARLHTFVEEAEISLDVKQSIFAIEVPVWLQVGDCLTSSQGQTQELLTKYVDALRALALHLDADPALDRVAGILNAALSYYASPSYLLDIDHAAPLQKSILATWEIMLERLPDRRISLLAQMTASMPLLVLTPEERAAFQIRRPSSASSWDGIPTYVACTKRLLQLFRRYYDKAQDENYACMILCLQQLNRHIACRFEAVSTREASVRHPVWQTSLELAFKLLEQASESMPSVVWKQATTLAGHLFEPSDYQSEEYVLTALNRLHGLFVPRIGDTDEAHIEQYCAALTRGSFFEKETDGVLVTYKDGVLREWCLLELLRMSTLCSADGPERALDACGRVATRFAVQRGEALLDGLVAAFPIAGHAPIKETDMHALTIFLQHLADPEVVSQERPRVRELCRACWPGLLRCLVRCTQCDSPKGLVENLEEALLQIGKVCF